MTKNLVGENKKKSNNEKEIFGIVRNEFFGGTSLMRNKGGKLYSTPFTVSEDRAQKMLSVYLIPWYYTTCVCEASWD